MAQRQIRQSATDHTNDGIPPEVEEAIRAGHAVSQFEDFDTNETVYLITTPWVSGSPWETATGGTETPAWEVPDGIEPRYDYPEWPVVACTYLFATGHVVFYHGAGKTGAKMFCNNCGEEDPDLWSYFFMINDDQVVWCLPCAQFNWEEMINGRYTWPE